MSNVNVNMTREYVVKPEEIAKMQSNEVYVFDAIDKSLSHTFVI
jgi:hypothetical protein